MVCKASFPFRSVGGFVVTLELQTEDSKDLLDKLDGAFKWVSLKNGLPVDPFPAPATAAILANLARPGEARQGENGDDDLGPDWCAVHHVRMPRHEGQNGQTWFSHKSPDGTWCRGK
jgi:hypothetical protein